MKPILVLGIGNILLADEGVGIHVVHEMAARADAARLALPDGVELFDGGTFGIDLLDTLAGRRKVIVVDAVRTDAAPATVLRFTAADLVRREATDLSLHQVGLLETLTMAGHLGCAPDEVVIFGIVPGTLDPGLELSPEVAAVVPRVVDLVVDELKKGTKANRHARPPAVGQEGEKAP
jgi:hydrogenase maturation protease